jgi:hypothetical protein
MGQKEGRKRKREEKVNLCLGRSAYVNPHHSEKCHVLLGIYSKCHISSLKLFQDDFFVSAKRSNTIGNPKLMQSEIEVVCTC